MCDHLTVHTFTAEETWRDGHNQNFEHAVCLDCGIIGSLCGDCTAFYPVQASEYGGCVKGAFYANGVERCQLCTRCVRCCPDVGRELPIAPQDIAEAVRRFLRATRHEYVADAKGNPAHQMGQEMDAHRFSAEEGITGRPTPEEGARWLVAHAGQCGAGRRGDTYEWRPRGAERYDDQNCKLRQRAPAGLWIDFAHHRGTVDPITLARAIRALPRRTYVCLGCGGEFVSALAECPFWCHQQAAMAKHGLDHDAYHASPYSGRRGGRLLITDNVLQPDVESVETCEESHIPATPTTAASAQLALF